MRQATRHFTASLILAFKDLWHDRKISFCLIVSLSSVVAPLLLLFGLKSGIIASMEEEFLRNPQKREIKILGHRAHDQAWFDRLNGHPETAFLIPQVRILNAQVDLVKNAKSFLRNVEVIPTKDGDPLLAGYSRFPAAKNQVVLSHTVARALDVQAGDPLTVVAKRKFEGHTQAGKYNVSVIGVLPESAYLRKGVFVDFALLLAVDDFKDEFAVPEFGIEEGRPRIERTTFASARVFAQSLQGVAMLADFIRDSGVDVMTHAKDIEMIQQTEKVLSFIVKVIAGVAVLGGAVSLAGFLYANIDRKRQHIAMLRLLGFSGGSIAIYPVIQSLVIATFGFMLAGAGYYFGAMEFDRVLGSSLKEQNFICRLSGRQLLAAYLMTDLAVFFAAIIGGFRAIRVEPAEIFRQQ